MIGMRSCFGIVAAFAMAVCPCGGEVSLSSLLNEMQDRDSLAALPSPSYQSLQASSYNRLSTSRDQADQDTNGWFADSDGVSWIREETVDGKTEYVIMEHEGPGCITRIWTPYFYYNFDNRKGPNIRVYLDGSTTPVLDENFIELLTNLDWPTEVYGNKPSRQNRLLVPAPFAQFTARAGDLYLPIPFAEACKITLTDKAFYNIVNYRAYAPGTVVKSFSLADYRTAASHIQNTGRRLLSPTDFSGGPANERAGTLEAGGTFSLDLPAGSAAIRHVELQFSPADILNNVQALRSTVLVITCDGEPTVWCPVGDFFSNPNRLRTFRTWTRTVAAEEGRMTCRWVMPYKTRAQVSLVNLGANAVEARLRVRIGKWAWDENSMYFHANWRGEHVQKGSEFIDWNFIDIKGRGVMVGDSWTVLNLTRGWWGEGDEKIYIDDAYDVAKFPNHFGTGTEDYYGWAGGRNPTQSDEFSSPFLANVSVGSTDENNSRGFNINTRIRALDAIPFQTRLVFDLEASPGVDQRNPWDLLLYNGVTFWYARPGAISNRPPLPEEAAKPMTSLDRLQARSDLLREVRRGDH